MYFWKIWNSEYFGSVLPLMTRNLSSTMAPILISLRGGLQKRVEASSFGKQNCLSSMNSHNFRHPSWACYEIVFSQTLVFFSEKTTYEDVWPQLWFKIMESGESVGSEKNYLVANFNSTQRHCFAWKFWIFATFCNQTVWRSKFGLDFNGLQRILAPKTSTN